MYLHKLLEHDCGLVDQEKAFHHDDGDRLAQVRRPFRWLCYVMFWRENYDQGRVNKVLLASAPMLTPILRNVASLLPCQSGH